jgi:hypothetical protein
VVSMNNIRIFHITFIACITVFMLVPLVAQAENMTNTHANAKATLSASSVTPGQQLSLTLAIDYLDGVEIFLDLEQQNWHPLTPITHTQSEPTWHNNLWHVNYVVTLIAPLAGDYQLPELILHSYLQQNHQRLNIEIPTIGVRSSFSAVRQTSQLQPVEIFTAQVNSESEHPMKILISIVIALLFIFLVGYLFSRHKKSQNKSPDIIMPALIMVDDLITKAKTNGRGDWQALRQYMLQLGFDPLKQHVNSPYLELSHRYTSEQFTAENQLRFIALCQDCQHLAPKNKESENA